MRQFNALDRFIVAIGSAVIILLAVALIRDCHAFDIEAAICHTAYNNQDIRAGESVKLTVSQGGYYLSAEQESMNLYGQDTKLQSASVGKRIHLDRYPVYFFGQVGYYHMACDADRFGPEAIYIAQSKEYGYSGLYIMPMAEHYRLTIRDDFGAEIGAGFDYNLSGSLSLGLSLSYRYLKLWGDYDGLDANYDQWWIMSRQDDFGGAKMYVGVTWRF